MTQKVSERLIKTEGAPEGYIITVVDGVAQWASRGVGAGGTVDSADIISFAVDYVTEATLPVVPESAGVFDLGSDSFSFNRSYISDSGINFGTVTLYDSSGTLVVDNSSEKIYLTKIDSSFIESIIDSSYVASRAANSSAQGLQGTCGSQGSTGVQGNIGLSIKGLQGPQGLQGFPGQRGFIGDSGVQGPPGDSAAGIVGPQGLQGTCGQEGTRGVTGCRGLQGIDGLTGIQGPQGLQGICGVQGIPGSPGAPGAQGAQGLQGFDGLLGLRGLQGLTGRLGSTGAQGDSGVQGFSGASISGSQGLQGFPGENCDVQGPQGLDGTDAEIVSLNDLNAFFDSTTDGNVITFGDVAWDASSDPKGLSVLISSNDSSISNSTGVFIGSGVTSRLSCNNCNTIIGKSATVCGAGHTAIGHNVKILGNCNTAVGHGITTGGTSGDDNTIFGNFSCARFGGNTIVGHNSCSGASLNTFIGHNICLSGGINTVIGHCVAEAGTTHVQNVYIGNFAACNTSAGTLNVAIGYQSLGVPSGAAKEHNCTTAIGYNAGNISTTDGFENVTFLGPMTGSINSCINAIYLGVQTTCVIRSNTTTISSLSDCRFKTCIQDIPYGLDFINSLRPVQFCWNRRDGEIVRPGTDIGFLAQEVKSVEECFASESVTRLVDGAERLELNTFRTYPIAIKALQDIQKQINRLKEDFQSLKSS